MKITYYNISLTIPDWLEPLWPYDMPLKCWPTFCGAGNGFGDKIVPDHIHGVPVKPACFVHDMEWATSKKSWKAFQSSNNRFLKNIIFILLGHIDGWKLIRAITRATGYYLVVSSPVGWANFCPDGEDWRGNPVVKEKLHRLAMADILRTRGG